MKHALVTLALTLALALSPLLAVTPAAAQDAPPTTTGFSAPKTAAQGDGPEALLAVCDQRLTLCEKDKTGIDFLAAAYIALWVILLVFFILSRQKQQKLLMEMQELEARLARLQRGGGDA